MSRRVIAPATNILQMVPTKGKYLANIGMTLIQLSYSCSCSTKKKTTSWSIFISISYCKPYRSRITVFFTLSHILTLHIFLRDLISSVFTLTRASSTHSTHTPKHQCWKQNRIMSPLFVASQIRTDYTLLRLRSRSLHDPFLLFFYYLLHIPYKHAFHVHRHFYLFNFLSININYAFCHTINSLIKNIIRRHL